jgi:broad specificity phosphatase PhoE
MKEVIVIRHANPDRVNDRLTDEGRKQCAALKSRLGPFVLVVSSPAGRTQETAALLSGKTPIVDERAGVLKAPPEVGPQIAELRKIHPFGVAGAIISIPGLREPLKQQGLALKELVEESLEKLKDGERALIISHDGTMVAFEKVLKNASFNEISHTFGELEGFRLDEGMTLARL